MSRSIPRVLLPVGWVPVEHRWLGLDKRTIAPSVIVVAIVALLTGVFPAIDRSIEYDRQIEAGDVVSLGTGITFVPAVGWGFPSGLLLGETPRSDEENSSHLTAVLVDGAVRLAAITGPFQGTPEQLLDSANALNHGLHRFENDTVMGDTVTAVTSSGIVGVSQSFAGPNIEGFVATFVIDGTGVEFLVSGPPGALAEATGEISDMINSLHASRPGVAQ